jgi:hypothetical protein
MRGRVWYRAHQRQGEVVMPLESVNINVYGDRALCYVSAPGWKADYLRYLAARCDAHVQAWLRRNH